jgi:hypothetical protein
VSTLEEQAKEASLNRLWTHAVGIVNSIRTVGWDPIMKRPGDTEEPGTGCVGRWDGHHFILTAKHVVEKAQPGQLRIFCRPDAGIEYRSSTNLRPRDVMDGAPLNDPGSIIHRCEWEDLAVVTTIPSAVPNVEFLDFVNEWIDPPTGEVVHCLGFPFAYGQVVDKRMVGDKEERTVALQPIVFGATVLPSPTEDERKFKFTSFDPDAHYLVPFEDAAKGKHPRGISGAATWWETDQKRIIWRPSFKFSGACVASYKDGAVVQVVKASVVRRFLEEVFGSPAA